MSVLRTQLSGVQRRPARLLLTGLALLVASFAIYATVLAQQATERTIIHTAQHTSAAVDLVIGADETASPATLAKIQTVPGVAQAVGRATAGARIGRNLQDYLALVADPGTGPLAETHLLNGRYPRAAGEIALTSRTADRLTLAIGAVAPVQAAGTAKPAKLTVVGIVQGPDDSGSTAFAQLATVLKFTEPNEIYRVGVSQTRCR